MGGNIYNIRTQQEGVNMQNNKQLLEMKTKKIEREAVKYENEHRIERGNSQKKEYMLVSI